MALLDITLPMQRIGLKCLLLLLLTVAHSRMERPWGSGSRRALTAKACSAAVQTAKAS